jgi:prepilin-type N-terminal cleavage/methylation domain-containing protein
VTVTRGCSRAGFTLVEMLLAMILFLLTSSMIYGSLNLMERVQRTTSEKAGSQSTLRSGTQTLATELREVNSDVALGTSDLVAITDSSVTYWGMRSSGMTCQITGTGILIKSGTTYSGYRTPVMIRDSLLLFADHDTLTTVDDQWVQLPILGPATASTCPDGSPALAITTPAVVPTDYQVPGPVRTFELMQLAITTSGGRQYLGAQSVSGSSAMAPLIGPLATGGLRLVYRDQTGTVTTTPSAVRTIDIMVRSQSARPVTGLLGGAGTMLKDSLALRVLLRNAH